jgi:autotransporter-associated beta strand protein
MVKGGNKIWRRRIHRLLWAAFCCSGTALAQDGYWINGAGGNWSVTANWDPADGMAGGADNTAYFGFAREAAIAANATFTISGAQTIGNLCFTTQGGPAGWSFNPGAGGSLMLAATFGPPQITVTSPSLQVSLNVVVAGGSGVAKDGPGTLVLTAQNTYAGPTLVTGGALNVTGSIGTGKVTVNNATLSGGGVINGPVVIGAGGTLAPGTAGGPLTINNSLLLLPGSTTSVSLNGHPAVQGLTSITYGGTLLVNNLSGTVSLGQSFSLFGAGSTSGNFSSIQPSPGPWLRWRFNPATGQITVVSSASQPAFANVGLAGASLVCQITNGPPGSPCSLLAATNLSQPLGSWIPIATNLFDVSGNVTCTNNFGANRPGQVYLTTQVIPTP